MGFFPDTGIGSGEGGAGKATISPTQEAARQAGATAARSGGGKATRERQERQRRLGEQAERDLLAAGATPQEASIARRLIASGQVPQGGAGVQLAKSRVLKQIQQREQAQLEEQQRVQTLQTQRQKKQELLQRQQQLAIQEKREQELRASKIPITGFATKTKPGQITRTLEVRVRPGAGDSFQVERTDTGEERIIQRPITGEIAREGGRVTVQRRAGASPIITEIEAPEEQFITERLPGGRKRITRREQPPVVTEAESPKTTADRLRREADRLQQQAEKISASEPGRAAALQAQALGLSAAAGAAQVGTFARQRPLATAALIGSILFTATPIGAATAPARAAVTAQKVVGVGLTGLGATAAISQIRPIQEAQRPSLRAAETVGEFGTFALAAKAIPIAARAPAAIKRGVTKEVLTESGRISQDVIIGRAKGKVAGEKVEAITRSITAGRTTVTRGKIGPTEFQITATPKGRRVVARRAGREVLRETELKPPTEILRERTRAERRITGEDKTLTITQQTAGRLRKFTTEGGLFGREQVARTRIKGELRITEIKPTEFQDRQVGFGVFTPARQRQLSPRARRILPRVRQELRRQVPITERLDIAPKGIIELAGVAPERATVRFGEFQRIQTTSPIPAVRTRQAARQAARVLEQITPSRLLRSKRAELTLKEVRTESRLRPEVEPTQVLERFKPGKQIIPLAPRLDIGTLGRIAKAGRITQPVRTGFGTRRSRETTPTQVQPTIQTITQPRPILETQRTPLRTQQPAPRDITDQTITDTISRITTQPPGFPSSITTTLPPIATGLIGPPLPAAGLPPLPPIGRLPPLPPFIAQGLPRGPVGARRRATLQRAQLTPTLTAAAFQITGERGTGEGITGLGLRPLTEEERKRLQRGGLF